MQQATFVVLRRGVVNESTVAIVSALVQDYLAEETAFLSKLREVITVWMNTDPEGRAAWSGTGFDFNIGDFPSFANIRLFAMLEENGIHDMHVNIVSSDNAGEWVFDTQLFDESQIGPKS